MTQQFYKMTLADAINDYKQGLISATALMYYYCKITIKPGWKQTLHQQEISKKLGISKAAFYKSIARLKEKDLIDFETPNGVVVSIPAKSTECPTVGQNEDSIGQIGDSIGQNEDSIGQIGDSIGQIGDLKRSKPLVYNGSSDSPDLYSDSYQIFLKSLSDGERKNFLNFCQEEAKNLPKPPTLPTRWIERNLEDLKAKWESFCGTSDDSSNHQSSKFSVWANHPRFDELWLGVCTHGTTGFVIQNIRDTTIRDFCKFCHESPEITEEILSCLNSH